MSINTKKSILETPYPKFNVTNKTIDKIAKYQKFYRGHVRTATGRLYTNEQFKIKSDEILGKELP